MAKASDRTVGLGITTKQVKKAPKGAYYVWPFRRSVSYLTELLEILGRKDLKIVFPSDFQNDTMWRGLGKVEIVIDHAVVFTTVEKYIFNEIIHSHPDNTSSRYNVPRVWKKRHGDKNCNLSR